MSDLSHINRKKKSKPIGTCRVAYTLNNDQPVRCTIIDDHPLFYMNDAATEDEEIQTSPFTQSETLLMEQEIEKLRHQITQLERVSGNPGTETEELVLAFAQNAQNYEKNERSRDQSKIFNIEELIAQLRASRTAKAYLDQLTEYSVTLAYSKQVQDAAYMRAKSIILVNPDLAITEQVLSTARELRRHWQHRKGALLHPLSFSPDQAVLINRLQQADLSVSIVRIAWELQLAGQKEFWQRIENSSLADLGRAFAREAFLDFRTINNGTAGAAVFEAWFLSERARTQDRFLIKHMLADHQGYVFQHDGILMPGVKPALISALGEMPFGKNYLATHANTILNDPIFTDVRDRSNANFLWFIKFERTFRETEQALQSQSASPADGDRRIGASNDKKDSADDPSIAPAGAKIIDLASAQHARSNHITAQEKSVSTAQARAGNGADIIYIRRQPKE
jgi:hypothetical protein